MKFILAVGIGSFIGGILRYFISIYIQSKHFSAFPYGTLIVNVTGCFLIGIIFGFSERSDIATGWKLFLVTGILGGFTTFSSFSNETVALFRTGQSALAMYYIASSVLIGLAATFAGIYFIKLL